ncbi:MAG: Ltp family lipoprotein [Clostridium sp.]|uniref:Ltp family lipoprotein n=1 Tax=Clostridium sp. TaxID=1506 RepID=UPI003EE5F478
MKKKYLIGIIIVVIIFIIIISSGNSSTSTAKQTTKQATKSSQTTSSSSSQNSNSQTASTTNTSSASSQDQNALEQAKQYLQTQAMSKEGLYQQLTSQYGSGFTASQAKYAVDNLTNVDWNKEALQAAQEYLQTQAMSKEGLYQQLISQSGSQFTASQAKYAVDNLTNVNWNQEALKCAEAYLQTQPMSNNQLYQQLISQSGSQFTASQAQYAINNLPSK